MSITGVPGLKVHRYQSKLSRRGAVGWRPDERYPGGKSDRAGPPSSQDRDQPFNRREWVASTRLREAAGKNDTKRQAANALDLAATAQSSKRAPVDGKLQNARCNQCSLFPDISQSPARLEDESGRLA
ncbi:hypothetical protein Bbelb_401830 [Branchiostoma belcheri]|nr:hypothetical protein Bbelb_401830 [Branchiostoma belcheri]